MFRFRSDKTKESIEEMDKEFTSIIGDKPVTKEEFDRVQQNMMLQLPGMWETNNSVAGSVVEQVKFNLGDDYYKTYDAKVRKLTQEELQQWSAIVKPERSTGLLLAINQRSGQLEAIKL